MSGLSGKFKERTPQKARFFDFSLVKHSIRIACRLACLAPVGMALLCGMLLLGATAGSQVVSHASPGAVYGVWLSSLPQLPSQLPYLRGTQAEIEWRDVQPAPDLHNFSALDAAVRDALAVFPSGRGPHITVQVNANLHPLFLYDKLPACTNDTKSWAFENKDKQGVLQFWHPYYVSQYVGMLDAFAAHVRASGYRDLVMGVRMNWDGCGTECFSVPKQHRPQSQWLSPSGGLAPAPEFNDTTAERYQRVVFLAHAAAFLTADADTETLLLVRNNLDASLRSMAMPSSPAYPAGTTADALFRAGRMGWFHTSSEIEPRPHSGPFKYGTFIDFCKTGPNTTCYAEPWASAWGDHGGKRDDRWCPPPAWEYWRVLSDLHCGVKDIALYGSDMEVAAMGSYKGLDVGPKFQCEFNATFNFAARYAGSEADPSTAPGGWIAFRDSVSDLDGYNVNETDYYQLLRRDPTQSVGFDGMDARVNGTAAPVVENRTIEGLLSIGPWDQRFGAWARRLRNTTRDNPTEKAVLVLDPVLAARIPSARRPTIRVVYLQSEPSSDPGAPSGCKLFAAWGGLVLDSVGVLSQNPRWQQHTWDLPRSAANNVTLWALNCDVVVHMVEVALDGSQLGEWCGDKIDAEM